MTNDRKKRGMCSEPRTGGKWRKFTKKVFFYSSFNHYIIRGTVWTSCCVQKVSLGFFEMKKCEVAKFFCLYFCSLPHRNLLFLDHFEFWAELKTRMQDFHSCVLLGMINDLLIPLFIIKSFNFLLIFTKRESKEKVVKVEKIKSVMRVIGTRRIQGRARHLRWD